MTDSLYPEALAPFTGNAPDLKSAELTGASKRSAPLTSPEDGFDEHPELLSNRQLRGSVNRVFRMLESANPPYGARNRYGMLVDEIDERARETARRSVESPARESFRDNALYRRFELRIDGSLGAYVEYRIRAGRIALIDVVEMPGYRDQGVDAVILRRVLIDTHRRRLSVVPQCPTVFAFLADNPQYQVLAASGTAPSTHLHS